MRASEAHHHLSSSNIMEFDKLGQLFGDKDSDRKDIVGAGYKELLNEIAAITEYQWRSGERRGMVKGFLFSGPPGTGKTTIAKRLAYEMGRRFESESAPPVALAFVDGGEISRSRYGESEERIRDIFVHAQAGFTAAGQHSILLFDDVESIFMARGAENAKEWHFSQDSVFFHAVDELDTSRSMIVLTTNRPDLVDEAIRDRFLSYVIDYPDIETLMALVERLQAVQQFSQQQMAKMKDGLAAAVKSGDIRSMRDAQRFAMRHFISAVLHGKSLAQGMGD